MNTAIWKYIVTQRENIKFRNDMNNNEVELNMN